VTSPSSSDPRLSTPIPALHPAGWTALALLRIVLLAAAQAAAAGILRSRSAALPWWPFSILFANACCLVIMIRWTRTHGSSFRSLQLRPFGDAILSERILLFLARSFPRIRIGRAAVEGGLFLAVLVLLGLPAILFQEWINAAVPALRAAPMAGELPAAAAALLLLLPVSQGLVEFPWFYGFILPGMENAIANGGARSRRSAGVLALLITLAVFLLQIALLPPVFEPAYMLWQALAMLPLPALVGVALRLVPRWMPWINILHALMALNLAAQFWRMAR
jgi:hypothetical protein